MDNSLCIYISSFDGCCDLWDTFFTIFDTYWIECKFPIYLVNNEKDYLHKRVKVIHTGKEINWFDRTIRSLGQLKEEYVVFFLEDYFISKQIHDCDFIKIIKFMKKNNVYYYRLSKSDNKVVDKIRQPVKANDKYPISLQPAVWRKNDLLNILKHINGKSPWDFEKYYAEKYNEAKGYIKGIIYDNRDLLGYKNGVLRGKWIPATVNYYSRLGIHIDTSERGMLSKIKVAKYNLAVFISKYLPKHFKSNIKIILQKINFNYLK